MTDTLQRAVYKKISPKSRTSIINHPNEYGIISEVLKTQRKTRVKQLIPVFTTWTKTIRHGDGKLFKNLELIKFIIEHDLKLSKITKAVHWGFIASHNLFVRMSEMKDFIFPGTDIDYEMIDKWNKSIWTLYYTHSVAYHKIRPNSHYVDNKMKELTDHIKINQSTAIFEIYHVLYKNITLTEFEEAGY